VKVYLDENLSPRVAELLRARGIDAVSAHEAGNAQLDDPSQLRYAAAEGRVIVTANIVDFVELAAEAIAGNTDHAGIVLVPSTFRTDEFSAVAQAVEQIVQQYPGGLTGAVVYVRRAES
jgi:predicted nuclease of predicted toxin-antitoxin system